MIGARQTSFFIHSFWRGRILGSNSEKKQISKQKRKAPTCGHCAEVGQKRPFHHRGVYSNHHLASCRHLRYIELFPHSHHLPWGSYGSADSTKGGLDAFPMEVKCFKLCGYVIISWNSHVPTRPHYNCKCCTPTWVLILAVNGVQDIWICVNVVDNKKWLMNCANILNNDEESFVQWRHLLTTCWNSYPINSKISQQWVSFLFVY